MQQKTASTRVVHKTAEAAGDLIGNIIADKITSQGKKKNKEKEKGEQKHAYHQKRQQVIDDLRFF